MAILDFTRRNSIAVIELNNGKNQQDLEFAHRMNYLLGQVLSDKTVTALVISSTDPKNWTQGINLDWLNRTRQTKDNEAVRDFFLTLDQVYGKLMLLPVPTIAAITGHAFGAGAFLATACDYRFMNGHRGFFCFPEIDLEMDFLPGVFLMLEHKLPPLILADLILSGKRATADELDRCAFIEKACPNVAETVGDAIRFAEMFEKNRSLIASYKQRLHGDTVRTMIEKNIIHFQAKLTGI